MSLSQKLGLTLLATFLASILVSADERRPCRTATVPVNVLDERGIPIRNRPKDVFSASHGGHPVKILNSSFSDRPRRIAILLDVSGSMRDPKYSHQGAVGKWSIALMAVRNTVLSSPEGTRLSLTTFGTKSSQLIPLSADRDPILRWLDNNSNREAGNLKGHTGLYSAILEARKGLDPVQAGDVIYAVTDGGENASEASASRVRRELQASGIRLFIFMLQESHYFTEQAAIARDVSGLVFHSGGYQITIAPRTNARGDSPTLYKYDDDVLTEIKSGALVVNSQIRGFYSLTIDLSDFTAKAKKWKLALTNTMGKPPKDWVLTYPDELTACSDDRQQVSMP